MSHDFHEGPADAVLYDGCDECDARAANPLEALMRLDGDNMRLLWDRMLAVEIGKGSGERYRSTNEMRVAKGALYRIAVLLERHPDVLRLPGKEA